MYDSARISHHSYLMGEGKRKLSLSHLGFLSPPHSLKPATVLLLDYTHGFTLAFIPLLCVMVRHVCPSSFHYRRRAGTLCLLL